jgi:hypothetical protein
MGPDPRVAAVPGTPAAPAAPGASSDNPLGPTSPADAAKLPSGTWFTGQDNVIYRVR